MLKDDLLRYIKIKAISKEEECKLLSYKIGADSTVGMKINKIDGYIDCLKDIMHFIQTCGGEDQCSH